MRTPSICGGFLTDKRSLLAFTWTLTTIMTLAAFLVAIIYTTRIHAHYNQLERYYEEQYNNYNEAAAEEGEEGAGSQDSADRQVEAYLQLASITSKSMGFVAIYTMTMALGLVLYGSTAIVGFTSLTGVYIAPCFSAGSMNMRIGVFGGAIILFANLLLVCAVIFGEVRVEDYRDRREREEMEPYQLESIATVLAVTCMFLAALYTIFAVLLFLCYASEERTEEESKVAAKPLAAASHTSTGFITMEDSS